MADHSAHSHTTKPLADGATRTSYDPPVSQDGSSRTFVVSLEAKDGYAVITDFRAGDRIQLDCDELGDYQLIPGNHHGADNGGFCIFYVGDHRTSDAGDLIAEVSGPAARSLDLMDASTFTWKIPEGVAIAVGLPTNDIVMGTEANDGLSGCMGSDVVIGGQGSDVVSGVHTEMELPGRGEIDVLIGGPDDDRFVLGGHHGIYYKDVVGRGESSYGAIQDFEKGDRIVLEREKIGSYELVDITVGLSAAKAIYYNRDGKPGISAYDDLIARVQGPAARNLDLLDATTFQWVFSESDEPGRSGGSDANDILIGSDDDDRLVGLGGSDVVIGGLGDDTLIGVDPEKPLPGQGEIDVLIGDAGADLFVLGSNLKDFYLDPGSAGDKGYAAIQDLDSEDAIALAGIKGDYVLQPTIVGLSSAVGLYANRDGQPGVGSIDDLLAVIQGSSIMNLTLDSTQFRFQWGSEPTVSLESPVMPLKTGSSSKKPELKINELVSLPGIKDYDGNLHGRKDDSPASIASNYKFQGYLDVNNDDVVEEVYTNRQSGRWVTLHRDDITGEVEYEDHGKGGASRVVGIYLDPLVAEGESNNGFLKNGELAPRRNGEFDSQRRFSDDLRNDNLIAKVSDDFDKDGFQEVYWKTADGTAYLRAIMHADGNIQYANYQSEAQMRSYLTAHGFADVVSKIL